MTDRFKGATVVFDREIRDDDAEPLLNAIRMLKGVVSVQPVQAVSGDYYARTKAKMEMQDLLFEALDKFK